jgi:hypothetical protein
MEEIEIWRAANQMLKQFPEGADMVAAQRAMRPTSRVTFSISISEHG